MHVVRVLNGLSGISLSLWIWLRGIDRFLSRQMCFSWPQSACSSRAGCAEEEGRRGDWIAPVRPPRVVSAGEDQSILMCEDILIYGIYLNAWEIIPIFSYMQKELTHKKALCGPTCWWMKRWGPCRYRRRPPPEVGLLSPKRTWSDSGAYSLLFYRPLSELQPLVWSRQWLRV